jgi:peptidylamidoglycolate lyase
VKTYIRTIALVLALAATAAGQSAGSYEVSTNWAQLPAGVEWGPVIAVAFDGKDNIWVLRWMGFEPSVIAVTTQGKYLKSWGKGLFGRGAHSIYVDRDGFIWTTDNVDNTVYKFDQQGKVLMTLGKRGVAGDNASQDAFDGPSGVLVAPNGEIYVTDGYRNSRIVKFSKDGKFQKIIGGTKSSEPGLFDLPHGVVMDSRGRLVVADRNNKRVQILDKDGKFVEQWADLKLLNPSGLLITADDTVYVSDTNRANPDMSTITVVKSGKILNVITGLAGLPHQIAMDRTGALYMADTKPGNNVIKKISGTGP